MIKLNIGCGLDFLPDYFNIDIQDVGKICPGDCKFVQSSCNKLPFADRSVDEIYANQLLEHIHPLDIKEILAEWRRVLKIDGVLRIVFPDFDKVVGIYQSNCGDLSTTEQFMQYLELNYITLCSSQSDRVNTSYPHKSLLTSKFLTILLESEGFAIDKIVLSSDRRCSTEIISKRVLRD